MTRQVTNDEYLALALRYNEQRTINDSLQKEIAELKAYHQESFKRWWTQAGETADEWNNRNRIS